MDEHWFFYFGINHAREEGVCVCERERERVGRSSSVV